MKRSIRLYILLGVLAVVGLAAFIVTRLEERKEQIKNSNEIILDVSVDSVQSLAWENADAALSFHKDDSWIYDGDSAFPVDDEKINGLLEQFQSFGVSFVIDNAEDISQYGLDDPVCTIRFSTADVSYEILLGDYSTMDSQRYVSIGDGKVYLVPDDPLDSFDAVLSDIIEHDEIPVFETVTRVQFSGKETYDVNYEENSKDTYCAEDVYFTKQDGENMPLDTSLVNGYLSNISGLDLSDYATYNATEEELQSYGLDTPELSVTVFYTIEDENGEKVSDTFVLEVGRDPEEKKSVASSETGESGISEDEETITAYVRVNKSQIVYKISASDYKELTAAAYDDLRHKEIFTASFNDITRLDITLEGQSYTFTPKANDKDNENIWLYNEEETDITDLRAAIESLSAESFTSELAAEREEIRFTAHLNNENHPQTEIILYRYNGSHCLAAADGKMTSLIARSNVADLIEAVNSIVLN